jgi:hypothetical protein
MGKNNSDDGRRILVIGSLEWTSRALTRQALNRVLKTFKPPYTIVCDGTDGAAKYAAAVGREMGMGVELHELDTAKCGPECPDEDGHRRVGGPAGEWCPTAKIRNFMAMAASSIDVCIALDIPSNTNVYRDGRKDIKMKHGIGLWEYVQPGNPRRASRSRARKGDE